MHFESKSSVALGVDRGKGAGDIGIDPFYLYLDLVHALGEGHVFLLDAAKDNAAPQYQRSILGVGPVLEVMVKDHEVLVVAVPELITWLGPKFFAATFCSSLEPQALHERQSAVKGESLTFRADDPMQFLEYLRIELQALVHNTSKRPFSSGFLGYIGYDAVHYLETLPTTTVDDRQLPDIRLQWHASIIHLTSAQAETFDSAESLADLANDETIERLRNQAAVIQRVIERRVEQPTAVPELLEIALSESAATPCAEGVFCEDVSQDTYETNVRRAIDYIRAGDIFQVVLSKRLSVEKRLHHYAAYDKLRNLNPSPYMFMSEFPDMRLFGTSPEVQFRSVGGVAEMRPIAGTSKGRGATPEEDEQLVQRLLADEKEQAEHVMLVDLCRNDLGRVCQTGSVHVPEYLVAERYSHVIHLVSSVSGLLRPDVSVFHALLATFPAGTLSGAPKIRAMEIIDELESHRRGPYGGMMGMVDFDANANTAIIIRSVIECNRMYYIQAGAGIVADSNPEQEWQECGRKSGALLDVLLK